MIIYIIVYLIVFLLSFLIKKDKFNFWDFILILILVLFAGLRYEVGTDYSLYRGIYESTSNGFLDSATNRTGLGFSILNFFFNNTLHADFKIFILFCSAVTVISYYSFFKKYSSRPGLAILLYVSLGFYTSSFNGFRQHLSLSLILVGYMFFKERKKIPAVIFCIIGALIHSSSIIAIAVYYIIEKFKKKPFNLKTIYIPIIIIYLMFNFFFAKILGYFTSYSMYLDYDSAAGLGTYIMAFIYNFVLIALLNPNQKRLIDSNKDINKFFNYIIIGAGLMILQTKNWLFVRLVLDFNIFMPIVLSEFYIIKDFKNKKIESLIFYVFCFIYYLVYINSFGEIIPYNTFF